MKKWKIVLLSLPVLAGFLLLAETMSVRSVAAENAASPVTSKLVNVPTPTAPHEVSSQLCASCHADIYKEWEGTMHAQSTALTDPIHAAMYKQVVGDPTVEGVTMKNGNYPVCLQCHAPNAAIQKKTKLDAHPSFNEGVNCIACHTIQGFKGVEGEGGKLRLGMAAYDISKTSLQAPSGKHYTTTPGVEGHEGKPFHPYPMEGGNSALFKSSDMCMGCHAKRNNEHGIPVCATGDEIKASNSSVTCQACHMPVVNGRISHSMMGGHDAATVKRGVVMTLKVDKADAKLKAKIDLKNQLPHNFPTGAPFRNVYLQLTAHDAKGVEVWKNYTTHPLKDDKQGVLVYVTGDGEGKPTGSPTAKEILSDSRLKPHETRTLEYEIPADKVVTVRAELLYNLVLPEMIKHLEPIVGDDLLKPKQAAFAEVSVSAAN